MAPPSIPRAELQKAVEAYIRFGTTEGARQIGITRNKMTHRIRSAIDKGMLTCHQAPSPRAARAKVEADGRLYKEIDSGHILIGSDAHYYPNIVSTAHRAMVKLCRDIRPTVVVMNGDAFDGSTISRHPRIGWDNKPTVKQELEAVEERLTEIEDAAGTHNLYWPLGNHDARFETFLASNAPEFQGVDGFTLKSRFPAWRPCWSLWINDCAVIKHRFKGGIHATHNNTMWAGRSIFTGHLHSLKVTPLTDYNGTRWGVDCGTMAAPHGPQFQDYTEDNPVNWRGGLVLATIWHGQLIDPQTIRVLDEEEGLVVFGTEVFKV